MPADALVVLTTFDSEEKAREVASALLEERHIACANLIPGVRSLYLWKGEVADDQEWLAVMKTTRAAWPGLERRIGELHPYEVPELVALPAEAVAPTYLKWLHECCNPASLGPI